MQIGRTPLPYLCTMKIYCKGYKDYYWHSDVDSIEEAKEVIENDSLLDFWQEISVWENNKKVYVAFNRQ